MAKLPVQQAKSLAETMSKHGLSGSISMGKSPMSSPEDDDGETDDGGEKSELEHCASDLADALSSGDKQSIVSAIMDLVECIQHQDEDEDQEHQLGS